MSNLTCTGYASVFGNLDSVNDIMKRGAFRKALPWCANMPLLMGHDTAAPIGRVVSGEEDWYGLFVTIEIFEDIPKGKEVIALIGGGMRCGLSIGYRAWQSTTTVVDGHSIRTIDECELVEISVVTNPANNKAMIGQKQRRKYRRCG